MALLVWGEEQQPASLECARRGPSFIETCSLEFNRVSKAGSIQVGNDAARHTGAWQRFSVKRRIA